MAKRLANALTPQSESSADESELLRIQRRITEKARSFDLPALFDLLRWLGYSRQEIALKSHRSTLQQSAVVESVQFAPLPERRVTVLVNLGWFGPQSALPAYFQSILDQDKGDIAEAFLSFFSQVLLQSGVASSFPERNAYLFSDFDRTRQQLRSLLGARSMSTVHWVFAQTFPEAETCVKRTILMRPLRTRGMLMGKWTMGDGTVCGGLAQVPVSAIAVTLYCNEPTDGLGNPWAVEAERRMRRECFAALAIPGLFLQVHLVIRDQNSFMVLQNKQYLGFDPLREPTPLRPLPTSRVSKTARTVVLWSGEVPYRSQGSPAAAKSAAGNRNDGK